jgi:hypothetical protein
MKKQFLYLMSLALLLTACGDEKQKGNEGQVNPPVMDPAPIPQDTTVSARGNDANAKAFSDYHTGDIIFQIRDTDYAQFVGLATKSTYNHVGIIRANKKGQFKVLEVAGSVKLTAIEEWIAQGKEGKFVVKRFNNADTFFDEMAIMNLTGVAKGVLGKKQDAYLDWSADEFYSSELVWKIFQAGIDVEVCETQTFMDFNVGDKAVVARMKEHYGIAIPLDHRAVSPDALFNSSKLFTVFEN